MPPFNPLYFWTELPSEIIRQILSVATRERETIKPIRADHSDVHRILAAYKRDQVVVGALRATNRGQPFRPFLEQNRVYYYELTQDVWKLHDLRCFRHKLTTQLSLNHHQLDHAYVSYWFSLNGRDKAVRKVAQGDPDALKRALCAIKDANRHQVAHERNAKLRDC